MECNSLEHDKNCVMAVSKSTEEWRLRNLGKGRMKEGWQKRAFSDSSSLFSDLMQLSAERSKSSLIAIIIPFTACTHTHTTLIPIPKIFDYVTGVTKLFWSKKKKMSSIYSASNSEQVSQLGKDYSDHSGNIWNFERVLTQIWNRHFELEMGLI